MPAYADLKDRPDWLKEADGRAFKRFMRSRSERPRAAIVHGVVDLAQNTQPLVEWHGAGAGWEHKYALAAAMLERLKWDPELASAEIVQARLDAALEALDVRNVYLTTGPVKEGQ